jgi:hypothetical protein
VYKSWKTIKTKSIDLNDHSTVMAELLSHPSIASKESWVRQYDHEVQGATVVKPFEGLKTTAPNDAGVLWYGAYGGKGNEGISVASGLCPHFSMDDAKLMSELAVDEAVRNLLCHGTDPEKIALVDNFCWPDPTPSAKNPDAEFKVVIEAHADEISWFVNYITPEGYIYVRRNGGSDHMIAPSAIVQDSGFVAVAEVSRPPEVGGCHRVRHALEAVTPGRSVPLRAEMVDEQDRAPRIHLGLRCGLVAGALSNTAGRPGEVYSTPPPAVVTGASCWT